MEKYKVMSNGTLTTYTYETKSIRNPIPLEIWESILDDLDEAICAEGYRLGDARGNDWKPGDEPYPYFEIMDSGEVRWFQEKMRVKKEVLY